MSKEYSVAPNQATRSLSGCTGLSIILIVNRRMFTFGLGSVALCKTSMCAAQPGALRRGWRLKPSIGVLFAEEDDPRLPLVGEASAFWIKVFSELPTTFRLGTLRLMRRAIPAEDLKMLAASIDGAGRPTPELPESVRQITCNIVVALSDGDFISFAAWSPTSEKALVAIKSPRLYPLTLPNVARNVIAHELGHAVGLHHNEDPTTLMCGRPAPCRPGLFAADIAKYFPLSEIDKDNLRRMYPTNWPAAQ